MLTTTLPLAESITLSHKGAFTIVDSDMRQGKGDFTLSEDGSSIYTVRYAQNSDQGEPYKLFRVAKYDLPNSYIVPEDFASIPTTLNRTDIGLDMLGLSEGVGQDPVVRTFEYADPDISNGFFIILGLHEKNGKLIVNNNIYYAANGLRPQTTFVFDSNNLNAAATAQDPTTTVEDYFSMRDIGKMLGNMSNVPTDWQSFFGGEIFSGANQSSITTNWSAGPSLLAFSTSELVTTSDPDDLVQFGAEPLMYYPDESIGSDGTPQALYDRSLFTLSEIEHINTTNSFTTDVLGTNTALDLLSGEVSKNEWWNDQSRVITQFIVPNTRTLAVLTNTLGTTRQPYYTDAPTQPYEYQKEYNAGITTAVLDENGKPVPELDENGQIQLVQKGLIYKSQSWIYDEELGDYTLTPPSGGGSAAIRDDKYLSVLLFDTNDLQKVKDGELLGYQVQPYKQQLFKNPLDFTTGDGVNAVPQCGDFNNSTGELFLSYRNEYQFSASSFYPVFNAFDVSATSQEGASMGFNQWNTFNQWSVGAPVLPVDTTPPQITFVGGSTITLTVGDSYTPQVTAIDANDGTLTPTISNPFVENTVGTYTVTATATDVAGNVSSATQTVIVEEVPANQPPTANAGPDQSVAAGVPVQVSASGSNDGDGTIVGWKWRETTNSGITLSSTTAESISFTSPVSDTDQTVTLELIVTDDDGVDSAPVYVDFNVAAEVDTTPPVVILTGGNIALNVGEVFQEPGYQAFNNKGVDITNQVTVTGSTSTAFPRTGTLEYNVVADGIAAETQTRIFTVTAEPELLEAVSKQKFLRDNTVISAFTGRSNIEELKFQLASTNTKIALDNQGYYDFDENETQKVIVVTEDGEISSENGDVEWKGSSLFVRFGAFSSRKSQLSARVVVFLAGDKRGVVIAGPGLNANLLVKFN